MKKLLYWRIATAAALLLLSYIFWQWRFEKVSQNLVPADACQNVQHWQGMTTASTVSFSDDGLVIHRTRGGASSSVFIPLGDLRDARLIAVKCDVAWEDCERDPKLLWAMPRIVLIGSNTTITVVTGNAGNGSASNVTTVLQLPPGLIIVMLPPGCSASSINVTCGGSNMTLPVGGYKAQWAPNGTALNSGDPHLCSPGPDNQLMNLLLHVIASYFRKTK
jgi:hypothetical protein